MSTDNLPREMTPAEAIAHFSPLFIEERWQTIPGWPAYKASSHGRIMSFWAREGSPRNGTLKMVIGDIGKVLKRGFEPKTGHPHVTLGGGGNGVQSTFKPARLVLMAFDRLPEDGEDARHIYDPDPTNCHLWNLAWGSRSENWDDFRRHNGRAISSKLTIDQVHEIKAILARDDRSQASIAREYGVCAQTITNIKLGAVAQWSGPSVDPGKRDDHAARYPGVRDLRSKLTDQDILDIKQQWANGDSQKSIAAIYGVDRSHISKICTGKYIHK